MAGSVEATGMLLIAICAAGTVASSAKVALYAGSSHDGTTRRAFAVSNWVKSARSRPCGVS